MSAALPWIMAGTTLYNTFHQPPTPSMPATMGYDEARGEAEKTLAPVFERLMQDTLADVDNRNIARGFFGQAPGAALAGDRAANVAGQQALAIGSLADQMVGQSYQNAAQMAALAQNQWANQQQASLQKASFANSALEQILKSAYLPRRELEMQGIRDAFSGLSGVKGINSGILTSLPSTTSPQGNYLFGGSVPTIGSKYKPTQSFMNPY